MLLRWSRSFMRDELRIFVHREYVLLTHLKRQPGFSFKQRIMHHHVLTLDLSEPLNQWNGFKNSLADALNSEQWQKIVQQSINANVIISSHFARYAVIPWSVDLAVESERQAFMRYRFNALFGDTAKAWDLQMSEPEFGQPTIASGIDSSLLNALHEVLVAANIRVNSISPYLMLAINQSVQHIKQQKTQQLTIDQDFWFAVVESERLCFALIENSAWRLVKNVALDADLNAQLNTLIQREMVNCNINSTLPLVIYQAESGAEPVLNVANFTIIEIQSNEFEEIKNGFKSIKNPAEKSVKSGENKWQKARV